MGRRLTVRHLPPALRAEGGGGASRIGGSGAGEIELNLQRTEAELIRRALEKTDSNRTEAAKLLGISRRTLQRKLKEVEGSPAEEG